MSDSTHNRYLYCIVKDQGGNQIKTKTVLIRRKATITQEPVSAAAYAQMDKKVTVKISALGDGLTYTWYVKNAGASKYSKSSITASSYSVKVTDKVAGRQLYCTVTDQYGNTVQTVTVTLKMK